MRAYGRGARAAVAIMMVLGTGALPVVLAGCSTLELLGTTEAGDSLSFHGLRETSEGWIEMPRGASSVAVNLDGGHAHLRIEPPGGGEPVFDEDIWASTTIDLGTDSGGRFHFVVDASGEEEGATGEISVNAVS